MWWNTLDTHTQRRPSGSVQSRGAGSLQSAKKTGDSVDRAAGSCWRCCCCCWRCCCCCCWPAWPAGRRGSVAIDGGAVCGADDCHLRVRVLQRRRDTATGVTSCCWRGPADRRRTCACRAWKTTPTGPWGLSGRLLRERSRRPMTTDGGGGTRWSSVTPANWTAAVTCSRRFCCCCYLYYCCWGRSSSSEQSWSVSAVTWRTETGSCTAGTSTAAGPGRTDRRNSATETRPVVWPGKCLRPACRSRWPL